MSSAENSSHVRRRMSASGDTAGAFACLYAHAYWHGQQKERITLSPCGLQTLHRLLGDLGRQDCSNFRAAQCGGGAQDASEAAPGLLRRIRGVLLLWRVDYVQDEGRGNQAHQPWHQSCTRPQPPVRRLPQLAVQHQPAEIAPLTFSDCAFTKATESLKPGGSPGLQLPACKSLVME